MPNPLMTIREMCDMFGVTARTLRFYESKELLAPARQANIRLYNNRDRARLKLIQRGKRFGISLEEIRQILDLYDMDAGIQMQKSYDVGVLRLAEMELQRAELGESIIALKILLERGKERLAKLDKDSDS